WGQEGQQRTTLLNGVVAYLNERRWGKVIEAGWSNWDLRIDCDRWTMVQVCTTQEDHGGHKHVIPIRYRLLPHVATCILLAAATLAVAAVGFIHPVLVPFASACLLMVCFVEWRRSLRRAASASGVFDAVAVSMGLVAVPAVPARQTLDPQALSSNA